MPKVDYKKTNKQLYAPSAKEVSLVEVPVMNFLMIDGMGDPETAPQYKAAVEALFSVAYTLKFMIKKENAALDYVVMPLEGLWWVDETPSQTKHKQVSRDLWCWTSMIMQPEPVTAAHFEEARQIVARKKQLEVLPQMRFERFAEGQAVQILHIGPYAEEEATLTRLHAFFDEHGYESAGKHHEIYLSDATRTAPEKLHTVLRHPCRKSATS